jgi:ferritin-like metal-binding protein YciE
MGPWGHARSSVRKESHFTMSMQTAQDLFIHELGDMYDAEHRIAKMLPTLAQECNNDQVRNAFQMHEQQTRQQIQNLEQCFQALGTKPPKTTCGVIEGLKQEHDTFLKEHPAKDVLTMFDLGGASKTAHYEIASYTGLVAKARLMGQQQCAQLLHQNLQQEQEMSKKVEQLSHQLGQQMSQHMGQMRQTGQMTQQSAGGI